MEIHLCAFLQRVKWERWYHCYHYTWSYSQQLASLNQHKDYKTAEGNKICLPASLLLSNVHKLVLLQGGYLPAHFFAKSNDGVLLSVQGSRKSEIIYLTITQLVVYTLFPCFSSLSKFCTWDIFINDKHESVVDQKKWYLFPQNVLFL